MVQKYKIYINGEWTESVSGETFTRSNPANKNELIGEFQKGNEQMKELTLTLVLLFGLLLGFIAGFLGQDIHQMSVLIKDDQNGVTATEGYLIPTRGDIQQMLVDRGYDIGPKGVDGKIGEDTITAWDRAICDQYAAQYFGVQE